MAHGLITYLCNSELAGQYLQINLSPPQNAPFALKSAQEGFY